MKTPAAYLIVLLLCTFEKAYCSVPIVTNSIRGIYFSISVTNNLVLPDRTNVFQCHITNISTNRACFYPWDPKVSTQFFISDPDGNEIRLTKDLSNSFRGGPVFALDPHSTNNYSFALPVTFTNLSKDNNLCAEVTVYFKPTETDQDSNGIVVVPFYHLRSNSLQVGTKSN